MKITKEDLSAIAELLSDAETFRPLVKSVLDTIESFGPELKQLPERAMDWAVKHRIKTIGIYEKAGFSREDAITMTLDDVWAFKRMVQKVNTKK